jgi:WD40 repeat protein/serine/threonine protein kinase
MNPTLGWYYLQIHTSAAAPLHPLHAQDIHSAHDNSSDTVREGWEEEEQTPPSMEDVVLGSGPQPGDSIISLQGYLEELESFQRERELLNKSDYPQRSGAASLFRCQPEHSLPPDPTPYRTDHGAPRPVDVSALFQRLSCRISSAEEASSAADPFGCHPNIVAPLFSITSSLGEDASTIPCTLVFYAHSRFTLDSVFRFSKDILAADSAKQYVAEQLIRSIMYLHSQGMSHGHLSPSLISMSETFWVRLLGVSPSQHDGSARSSPLNVKLADWASRSSNWPDMLEGWMNGTVSNFDYLMTLNSLAGRRLGDPNFHPVLPWVIDFKSPTSWRDLSVSKYRQNKGDEQLDLTFTASASSGVGTSDGDDSKSGHHVSDIMSELTFFNYFARRMPVWVLQKYVRTNFQPSEYPASMERLFSWSPDECIPEFFQDDQDIISSIHSDMPDIGLPEWAGADWSRFVALHRAALESEAVSSHIHQWIDLTFGYKLSGEAGKVAKNVALMDRTQPRSSGYIQLFSLPHPSRVRSFDAPVDLLSHAEHVARFVGHADRLEAQYLPCVTPLSEASYATPQWLQFCDLVSLGAIIYQLTTNQPLLHPRSWNALSDRLRSGSGPQESDWSWWCSYIATESSRIPSFRLSRLIFQLVFSNQEQLLRTGTFQTLAEILSSISDWERKGMDLVYGFCARFESMESLVSRARHATTHISILTNQLPIWAVNLVVPYLLPFFRDSNTQLIALELVEPLCIILGRPSASRLLLDHICTLYETKQQDRALYSELSSFKFVSMLLRQLGLSPVITKIVPHVVSSIRLPDASVATKGAECILNLVGSLGPHLFAKHVLSLAVQQITKPTTDPEIVKDSLANIASQIGDEYCCSHLFALLLALLQKSLFGKATATAEEARIASATLKTLCRILELPFLASYPVRVVKALLIDHPLLVALFVYPHLVDKNLYLLVVDCVFSLSRCVGLAWALRHVRPFVAAVVGEATAHSQTNPSASASSQSIEGLDLLVSSGWSAFGPPGAFCSPQQRALVLARFSDLLEASAPDEALSNWASIASPVITEAQYADGDVMEMLSPPVVVVSRGTDNSRDPGFVAPLWLSSVPLGPPPMSAVPIPTEASRTDANNEQQPAATFSRAIADQITAWLNPKRSSTWGFAGAVCASFKEHTNTVRQLAVHDSERLVLSASKDGSVKCWDIYGDGLTSRITYTGHKSSSLGTSPSSVAFVDRGGLVASCDTSIHIWELERAMKVMQIDHSSASFQCLCPMSDGRVVAAATTQATVSLTDLRAPQSEHCEWLLPNNQSGLPRVVAPVLHDGYLLAVGQSSGYVTFIDIRSGLLLYSWHAHDGAVLDLKPWHDGQNAYLLSCSQDKNVSLWNIHSQLSSPTLWNTASSSSGTQSSAVILSNLPSLQSTYKGHRDTTVCFDTYQDCLFSASGHKVSLSPILTQHAQVKLDRKRLLKPSLKPNYITCMAVLPSTQLLMLGTEDGQVKVVY